MAARANGNQPDVGEEATGFFDEEDARWQQRPKLVGFKVIGDPNIPSGRYTFVSMLPPSLTRRWANEPVLVHQVYEDGLICPSDACRIHVNGAQYTCGKTFEANQRWMIGELCFPAGPARVDRFTKLWMGMPSEFRRFDIEYPPFT